MRDISYSKSRSDSWTGAKPKSITTDAKNIDIAIGEFKKINGLRSRRMSSRLVRKHESSTSVQEELKISKEVIINLWNLKNYLDLYISNLNGFCTDEEFESESKKFAIEFKNFTVSDLETRIKFLNSFLNDLGPDDLSYLINEDPLKIMNMTY